MKIALLVGMFAACVTLMGCTERPQTMGQRKADSRAFQGPDSGYAVPGWKVGDSGSWEQQIKTRAQSQNEYSRIRAQ